MQYFSFAKSPGVMNEILILGIYIINRIMRQIYKSSQVNHIGIVLDFFH